MRTTPYPPHKATVTSLDAIKQKRESEKPGTAYKIINDRLAKAAISLLKIPTTTPWSTLAPAIKEAVESSRIAAGKEATSEALKSLGLERFDD